MAANPDPAATELWSVILNGRAGLGNHCVMESGPSEDLREHPSHEIAARAAYDAAAARYVQWVGTEINPQMEGPIDRAVLAAFAEMVQGHSESLVADVGCGPGRVAAYLADVGIKAVGFDSSLEMVRAASSAHPTIPFAQGTLAALPLGVGSLAGIASWYSIINTPPELLGEVTAEFRRVIAPGGYVLVAFQAGAGEQHHRSEAFDRPVSLVSYRHSPDAVERSLLDAGFGVDVRLTRGPVLPHETTPQAFLLGCTAEFA